MIAGFDAPEPDEFPFIFDSWANSFRRSPWAGCVPNHLYDAVSREAARGILDRPGTRVLCAFPEGVRRIMGYSVSEPERGVLHWLYVKSDFRRLGVGRLLLTETLAAFNPDVDWRYTFRTRASAAFLGDLFRWDPSLARVK
jgi:ribosomal protein S18 acetylase RimI-like enzyme